MTATSAPTDKYYGVRIIFFILGLACMLPRNIFMTAAIYLLSRLKYPSINGTAGAVNGTVPRGNTQNTLEWIFCNVMILSSTVPLLIFTCLNSFIHRRIPQKLRISAGLAAILVLFLLTAALAKVKLGPLPFACLSLVCIACSNSFSAIVKGSLFGLAGLLPVSYTTALVAAEGPASVVAAVTIICALATGSALQDCAFGYFLTACAIVLLANLCYCALPRVEFFQYYMESSRLVSSSAVWEDDKAVVSVFAILKQIRVFAISLCLISAVTLGMFPAITVHTESTIADRGAAWATYFIPTSCFLLFAVTDSVGKGLPAVFMWPGADSIWLPVLVGVRVVFIPLFALCNVQPRRHLPVWFVHDSWYIVFMVIFAFSNGYLERLCLHYAPEKVAQHEAETAGTIMVFFLTVGLVLGAVLSYAFRVMI